MKIGILTFHSQQNYGGVLQCFALKVVLEAMGHDVVVVDRWFDEKNSALRREFAWLGWKGWIKLFIRGSLGCGDFGRLLRTIRTIRFVRGLGLTAEHFCEWSEIKQLGLRSFSEGESNNFSSVALTKEDRTIEQLDTLVVGSDQVWHCGDWGDPRVYLLEDAPDVKAIAYAASFGMTELPEKFPVSNGSVMREAVPCYRDGMKRFKAISCREREGVEICRKLGFEATHVVDPTLLVERSVWSDFLSGATVKKARTLVCYFMSVSFQDALPALEGFTERMKCRVVVLMDNPPVSPLPKSLLALGTNYRRGRVTLCRSAGPREFVAAFASATWVLTDSFHAMMFSSIFKCNLRYLRPQSEMRRKMFARIVEFSDKVVHGPILSDSVLEALSSFERGEEVTFDEAKISQMRNDSRDWLSRALNA